MSDTTPKEKTEVYLEADKEIPGQHYICLSFISPQKVLKDKSLFFFSEFLKDYELQYKIRATEGFVMSEVQKLQETASKVQDALENLVLKKEGLTVDDVQAALELVKATRGTLTTTTAASMETHVKTNMSDFKESTIEEAYKTFMFKHHKRLEDKFFADNEFRTTVQGVKVRGSYDTYGEAVSRAKTLQKLDPSFNVYVGQMGFWLPWDPEPHEVADQEYADDQLNTLMKKYNENEKTRDELYASEKINRSGNTKGRGAPVGESSSAPKDMFSGEDLAIARKRELAAAATVEQKIVNMMTTSS
jgi:predicted nuclease of restriction endonuclease-like RecB superfamily